MDKANIIVSTGMHEQKELLHTQWIYKSWCIMHCVSEYPAKPENVQLSNIHFLQQIVSNDVIVGYSSHDEYGESIQNAVLAGLK